MDEKKIKVTDKRMFTPEGELREEFREAIEEREDAETPRGRVESEMTAASDSSSEPDLVTPESDPGPTDSSPSDPSFGTSKPHVEIPDLGPGEKKAEFADLVAVLAQPIAMYLGDMPLPGGESAENLDAARLYIDLLDVLRSKTLGNLSDRELELLDELLYQTRLRYVQKRG